ncbi:MAG: phosphatidylglycerophosphatase A [Succinivibrio sp.]|nr:phosphatidylglycerophosphatase A [Succinivibrio sp.]
MDSKHDRSPLKSLSLYNPWHLIALGFGSGLAPKAPGTFGSLAALPICMFMLYTPWPLLLLLCLVTMVVGTMAADKAEAAMGTHDNSAIVVDEFLGMFIAIIGYPADWRLSLLAFVLFRFFDILKPFPVNLADRKIKGGLGVMTDDVLAGVYAALSAQIIFAFW